MQTVYLGLGSNLKDPQKNITKALLLIKQSKHIALDQVSSLYITSPVSKIPQPDFINAVCKVQTTLSPLDLLAQLQAIEKKIGKIPKPKDAPRIIDIDILFYGTIKLQEKDLMIPHPRWQDRLFVLVPLKELTKKICLEDDGCLDIETMITNLQSSCQHIQRT